jgi:nitroimidazol reductase NimA-like FMN-containing flavoprotein (pyridoxamine 5'-phosphate oxidase superfamily)
VGFSLEGVPIILPVNYGMVDGDVVVRTGEGVKAFSAVEHVVVAFEVDDVDLDEMVAWSVLVRGLCTELTEPHEVASAHEATPHPLVAEPGDRYLRIRTGVLTGRRFALTPDLAQSGPDDSSA